MRRCLVTGGAGFIGSHLVDALLEQGTAVRVLDDFSTGRRENLETSAMRSRKATLELIEGDVRDAAVVPQAMQGVDVVFHEAAFISVAESMQRPRDCFDVNGTGTLLVLEAARKAGVGRAVIASSAAVYGESDQLPLAEQGAVQPLSPYAASKVLDEVFATLYTRSMGLEVCALRYFNVYGPRQRDDSPYAAAVPIFIRHLRAQQAPTIFGDGTQTRDLIFVGDVVRANLIAAEHAAAAGQVFNVCTGASTRILDLLEALYAIFPGSPPPIFAEERPGDLYRSVGNPDKAQSVLGFSAHTSLSEGLRKTVEGLL